MSEEIETQTIHPSSAVHVLIEGVWHKVEPGSFRILNLSFAPMTQDVFRGFTFQEAKDKIDNRIVGDNKRPSVTISGPAGSIQAVRHAIPSHPPLARSA